MIRFMISTDSTGYRPAAVSAESITTSAPSYTAVATSDASARVGTGELTIDSSIWVATTTGLPVSRHARTIRRCAVGMVSGGISTPRSPRATMTASNAFTMESSASRAAGFSSFAITRHRPPTSARSSSASAARCTNESAIQSTPSSRPRAASRRSLSDIAESGRTTPGTFTPLRSESSPPTTTSVSAKSAPCATTFSRRRPSSTSRVVPGARAG